jgi:carbon-monoxide dehydrogenase medium subunit
MIPASFDYLRPASIAEALHMASRHPGAAFLAGGHALLPERKLTRMGPSTFIDLNRITELRGIQAPGGDPPHPGSSGPGTVVRIGAMTTSAEIEYSPQIARWAPLLSQAAPVISDPLIRNRATLGGSLVQADPSGDWPPVMLAADATIHLYSRDGQRAVSASDFLSGGSTGPATADTGRTALRPGELLAAVTVPVVSPRTRSTYLKRMHPASGHAMLGVAATVSFDTGGTCCDCRIAITGTATGAVWAVQAENRLAGARLTAEAIATAADLATEGIVFTGDAFGSADYLAELLPVYVNRALTQIATVPAHT